MNRRWRSRLTGLVLAAGGLHACGGATRPIADNTAGMGGSGSAKGGETLGVGGTISGNPGATGGAGLGGVWIGGYGSCFEAGSRVATPRGSVPIEQLVVGDTVLAFDERSGSVEARSVTATFVHQAQASGRLALADGRVLRVTAEHPIYDAHRGAYARADAFVGGESMLTLTQSLGPSRSLTPSRMNVGLTSAAQAGFVAHSEHRLTTVYNISVEGRENYFVEEVLVHNKSGTGNIPNPCSDASPQYPPGSTCTLQPSCLGPSQTIADAVTLNEPVEEGGNEGGAGGAAEPSNGGAGSLELERPLAATTCDDLVTAPAEPLLVAFDYRMPEAQDAGTPGFALYRGPICAGTHIGEVDLTEYAPPAPGSLTTQCVKVAFPSLPSALTVRSLHPRGQVANVRVVASCECPRALKQWTSCGLTATPICQ